MSAWDQFGVYFVAGVFFCVGLAKVLGYRRGPRGVGAEPARLPFELPYACVVVVGFFEVVAGLALALPSSLLPQYALTPLAVAGLALLTLLAAIYQARRHRSMVPNIMLFLLVLFVAVVRWV